MTTASSHRRIARRTAAALAALALLAGCTSTVSGRPLPASHSAATSPRTPPAVTTSPSATPPPVPVSPTPAAASRSSPAPASASPATASPASDLPPGEVAGAPGAGDPYYPTAGNGGYQVDGYDIALTYDPETNQLDATTTVSATVTATKPLGRFDLDLQPALRVSAVTVDDRTAAFDHRASELVITPAAAIDPNGEMTVVVRYSGQPGMIADGTTAIGAGGWYRTADGGALAAGEPFSASAWYPVNEHPSDPATFSVTATVPDGWQVVSNGTRSDGALPTAPVGMHSVRYTESRPIASYLTTILIDKLTFTTDTFDGTPILNAFTRSGAAETHLADSTPQVLSVLGKHFGRFPFPSYGGIYTGENLPFALETATRPVYASWVDLDTVVHETAHQWYGDDVIIQRWSDVCLNECFASYAPWLFHQDVDGTDLDARWRRQMAQVADDPSFWATPLVDMGPGREFSRVYDRGPLAIHALRHEMGEAAFAALHTGWIATYGGQTATFDDLEAYASRLAGKDLGPFFDAWFRGRVVPPAPYRTPPGLN